MNRALARILLIAGGALLIVGLLWLRSCEDARSAKTQADLAKGQTGAALQSGHDAIETLGNAGAREDAISNTVETGTDAIHKAPGGDSNAAADRATCQLRSYRHHPKCIALLGPVAE